MAYNYFCCRKHTPPAKYSAAQPNNMPGVFASPMCALCGKTMEYYDSGALPDDPRPVPPPRPMAAQLATPRLSAAEQPIYSGSGQNPGHGQVTWTITRNAAKSEMTILLELGEKIAGQYEATHRFKLADGLLVVGQANDQENWWVNAPYMMGQDKAVWHTIDLNRMMTRPIQGVQLPPRIEIGIKLGNARFGMIHFLSGHARTTRNVGDHGIDMTGFTPKERGQMDAFVPLLSLQTGMKRFEQDQITRINFDHLQNKFVVQGQNAGLMVVTRRLGTPRYALTTLYNTSNQAGGTRIFPA